MTPIDRDDLERDAWLREALRHAPDADAAPPATLSEAILKQARAATAAAPAPRPASPWSAAWAWLARPPVAAGFASVMAATLVGLMWWERPMDEALPHPPAPERRGAPADAPAPAATSDKAAPAARVEAPNDVRPQAQGAAATPAPAPATPRDAPLQTSRRAVPAAAAPKQPIPVQQQEPEPFANERKQAATSGAPAREAVTAPRSMQPPAAAMPREPSAAAAAAKDAASPPRPTMSAAPRECMAEARDESGSAAAAPSRGLAASALAKAAPPPAATALRLRQDETTEQNAPLADTLASITSNAPLWGWQRGAGPQAMTPALQRWLMQLDAATGSHWRAAPAAAAASAGSVLRLYRAGELRATLRLDDDSVWFTPAGGTAPTWRAALAPTAAAVLKLGLDDAAP
jgi:hypothetical protein